MDVRRARPEDAAQIVELMAGLGRPPVAPDPAAQQAVALAHIEAADGLVLVVDGDTGLAACASLWFRPRLNWTTLEAWLPDLYVRPEHRRRGLARALLDACVAEARARGCHALKLESGHDRQDAHLLYEAYGFEAFGHAYRLALR